MTGELGRQYLSEYQAKTDPLLQQYLLEKIKEASKIGNIPAELLKKFLQISRLGKKLRGALVVLGYQIVGGRNIKAILDTSLFIELFHTGVLIHDDIMDQDNYRRGIPTLHKQFEATVKGLKGQTAAQNFGQSMAINAGDLAIYLSWEKLLKGHFPQELLLKAGKIYADFVIRLIYGQALDITNSGASGRKDKHILQILRYKTAEYSGVLPLTIGSILGGVSDPKILLALRQYGLALGQILQLQDDILGIFGKSKEIGKPVGSDLRGGKHTLLMFHLAKYGNTRQRALQNSILGKDTITRTDLAAIQKVLRQAGSYQYIITLQRRYVKEGEKAIPKITKNPRDKEILTSLLDYVMERNK